MISVLELGFKSILSDFGTQSVTLTLDLSWKTVEAKVPVYIPNCYASFMRICITRYNRIDIWRVIQKIHYSSYLIAARTHLSAIV